MVHLQNSFLSASISCHGAELCSLRTSSREYLWQADPQYWARHSPVLFPIVGSVYDKMFRVNGQTYPMGQHGFARDADFELVSATADEAWFRLECNAATLAVYPFSFCLEIGYRLEERMLRVMWRVTNPSADVVLPFQIGAHPAFYWPEHDAAGKERGYFAFTLTGPHDAAPTLVSRKLSGKGCVDAEATFPVHLDKQQMLALSADTFDAFDTIILQDAQVNRVSLCGADRKPILSLSFSSPLVGLWSPPGKQAPFVCIEPWYGRCDRYGYEGEFCQRDCVNLLPPHGVFNAHYTIEIHS